MRPAVKQLVVLMNAAQLFDGEDAEMQIPNKEAVRGSQALGAAGAAETCMIIGPAVRGTDGVYRGTRGNIRGSWSSMSRRWGRIDAQAIAGV